jgi:TolB-like protein
MDHLCQGLADELIDALAQIPGLRATARSRPSDPIPGSSGGTGAEHGVETVLQGSVRREGDSLRIHAELLRARDRLRLWATSYDATAGDLIRVERAIARTVAERLRPRLGTAAYTSGRYTSNRDLYDLYLKGRAGEPAYCQQAIDSEPSYAPAYSCLADAYLGMWTAGTDPRPALARARMAALTALRIDNRLAEAHLSMANIHLASWDWKAALSETQKAIDLAPAFGPALWRRANLLLFTGHDDEARLAFAKAEAADPMCPGIVQQKLEMLFCMRQYDSTIALAGQHSLDPAASYYSARAFAEKRMLREALEHYEEYRRRSSKRRHGFGALTGLYLRAGRREDAWRIFNDVTETARHEYVRPVSMAQLHAGFGDFDQAFQWLDKAYEQHDTMLRFLKVEPFWDPVRRDPRFDRLLKRINLQ